MNQNASPTRAVTITRLKLVIYLVVAFAVGVAVGTWFVYPTIYPMIQATGTCSTSDTTWVRTNVTYDQCQSLCPDPNSCDWIRRAVD